MGLWQQIKSGQIAFEGPTIPAAASSGMVNFGADDRQQSDVTAGKALIACTVHQISELWNKVETSGGSLAWEWIVYGSHHGPLIRQAEDWVNAIGSKGGHNALEPACNAWVAAWREGLQEWISRSSIHTQG